MMMELNRPWTSSTREPTDVTVQSLLEFVKPISDLPFPIGDSFLSSILILLIPFFLIFLHVFPLALRILEGHQVPIDRTGS